MWLCDSLPYFLSLCSNVTLSTKPVTTPFKRALATPFPCTLLYFFQIRNHLLTYWLNCIFCYVSVHHFSSLPSPECKFIKRRNFCVFSYILMYTLSASNSVWNAVDPKYLLTECKVRIVLIWYLLQNTYSLIVNPYWLNSWIFEFSEKHLSDLIMTYTCFNLPMKSQMKTFLWKIRADLNPWWNTCSSAATRPFSPHSNTVRLPLCGTRCTAKA